MKHRIDNPQYFAIIANGATEQGQLADPVLFDSIIDAVDHTMYKVREKPDIGYIDVYLHCDIGPKKYCTFQWKKQDHVTVGGVHISASWYQFIRMDSDMVGKSIQKGERISKHGKLKAFSIIVW